MNTTPQHRLIVHVLNVLKVFAGTADSNFSPTYHYYGNMIITLTKGQPICVITSYLISF